MSLEEIKIIRCAAGRDRITATAPCLWCVLARGLETPGFFQRDAGPVGGWNAQRDRRLTRGDDPHHPNFREVSYEQRFGGWETPVGVVPNQVHRSSRGIFWNQKMTKGRVAEHAGYPHICCTRTWGVHPHASASEERSESWQNPCLLRERSRETTFCATEFRRKLVRSWRN